MIDNCHVICLLTSIALPIDLTRIDGFVHCMRGGACGVVHDINMINVPCIN